MDRSYTIKSLTMPDIAGAKYWLTLEGDLTIKGNATTMIAAGTISGLEMEFVYSDGVAPGFDWEGGTFKDTTVTVPLESVFHMSGTGDRKLDSAQINDLAAASDWVGTGSFVIDGTGSKFYIGPESRFNVSQANDDNLALTIYNVANTLENWGTFSVSMATGKSFNFQGPGWVKNYGTMSLTQGKVATTNLQNSGTVNLAQNTEFTMGLAPGGVNGETVLDSTQSPSATSVVSGGGYAVFKGDRVRIPGGSATVTNVNDYGKEVSGTGTLVITGVYY